MVFEKLLDGGKFVDYGCHINNLVAIQGMCACVRACGRASGRAGDRASGRAGGSVSECMCACCMRVMCMLRAWVF